MSRAIHRRLAAAAVVTALGVAALISSGALAEPEPRVGEHHAAPRAEPDPVPVPEPEPAPAQRASAIQEPGDDVFLTRNESARRPEEAGEDDASDASDTNNESDASDDESDAPVAIPHCQINPWVRMPERVRPTLASIAEAFHERTGKQLRVTSGTRTPEEQAWLMYRKMRSGANIVRIYKATKSAQAIRRAYRRGRSEGLSEDAVIAKMTAVIARQVNRGVYISRHLRAGAVDIGARGMSSEHRAILKRIIRRHRVHVLDETKTRWPHFHLAFR